MLLRRRMMGKSGGILPAGYTQVEYIENTNTQYILTGVLMTPTCSIDIKYSTYKSGSSKQTWVCGGYAYSQSCFHLKDIWQDSGTTSSVNIQAGTANYTTQRTQATEMMYVIQADQTSGIMVNGDSILSSSFTALQNSRVPYFAVFGYGNESATGITKASNPVRIHYCRLYDQGNDLLHLIPCINPQNEVGMYDLVSQQFFGNDGEGVFIAGNPV